MKQQCLTNEEIEALENNAKTIDDKYRLKYHLMPPVGWLNDPNGLCYYKGQYHIFYQYTPEDPTGGRKYWGHYTTKDFVHFIKEKTALFPNHRYDSRGAYSGAAIVADDKMHVFYTGNVKHIGDYDYITDGREHNTMYSYSDDGVHFKGKMCLLTNDDYPQEMTRHVRDPYVIKKDDFFYLFLGARSKENIGVILVYQSSNLHDWKYLKTICSDEPFGYMWECPSYVELDQKQILICSPQGVESQKYKYQNLYQSGYFIIDGDFRKNYTLSAFFELDYGWDFYAPQVVQSNDERKILIAWMGMPDVEYTNPTVDKGWQHALCIPREISWKNDKVYQYPIAETKQLRKHEHVFTLEKNKEITLEDIVFEMHLDKLAKRSFDIKLRQDLELQYHNQIVRITMKESGCLRDAREFIVESIEDITIFSDTSSIEIFINKGEYTFTTRIYDDLQAKIEANIDIPVTYYKLRNYEIKKHDSK